ncbi:phage virion morphogenesis protein [Agrobacterium pusense]|uniref:phage virion morphogenesis protein n=1 Tax=Agrobacterium pusense TaxID=648995 RepID=UPI000D19DB19|nr:phage virion morphogenesis protein [Agrobacterium pusense]
MTGISYKTTINDADMREKLAELVERMTNREGFHKNVGEHLLNSTDERFDSETAPDGSRWKTLSLVTRDLRMRKYGNAPITILRASGALRGSINMVASENEVRIGSALVYAAIHQLGGEAGRNRKVSIPARPYLGLSSEDETEIFAIAEDWLEVE